VDTRQILCISLTPIERDARVLRQIRLLSEFGEVTTVGFGEHPAYASHHIRVPDGLATLPQTPLGVLKLALRLHRQTECTSPAAHWVVKNFSSETRWDLVVANDARVLDLAFQLAGSSPVWADMHEWAPEERTHVTSWRLLVAPFMVHLCSTYLPQAALVTTVSRGIIQLYRKRFGVSPRLMTNAGPFQDLSPTPVQEQNIRCVHSGAAIEGRGLETMVDIFANRLPEHFTLDLFLVAGGDRGAHLSELKQIAAGSARIRFHEPVAPAELPRTLNEYDLGVFWIPPTHTNAKLTLPNKFFDYVQARLGIAIGPSGEMAAELNQFGFGVVARSFDAADLAGSIQRVTPAQIRTWKNAADQAAEQLGFDAQVKPIRNRLASILATGS
jgi:hypothetical protein